jgi:hypothetical protein
MSKVALLTQPPKPKKENTPKENGQKKMKEPE